MSFLTSIGTAIHNLKIGAKHSIDTVLGGIFGKGGATVIEDSFTAGVHDVLRKLPQALFSIAEVAAASAISSAIGGSVPAAIIAVAMDTAKTEAIKQGIALEGDAEDALHTTVRLMVQGQIAAAASTAGVASA